jgi:hypothetical protein
LGLARGIRLAPAASQGAPLVAHRMRNSDDRVFGISIHAVILAIVLATAATLYALGRLPVCACGSVKLWHGQVLSSENSQHVTDWYTFSHILHGFLFYALLMWLAPGWSFAQRLAAAVAIEAGREILENTPLIIDAPGRRRCRSTITATVS